MTRPVPGAPACRWVSRRLLGSIIPALLSLPLLFYLHPLAASAHSRTDGVPWGREGEPAPRVPTQLHYKH